MRTLTEFARGVVGSRAGLKTCYVQAELYEARSNWLLTVTVAPGEERFRYDTGLPGSTSHDDLDLHVDLLIDYLRALGPEVYENYQEWVATHAV